jgi:hypothetical protein
MAVEQRLLNYGFPVSGDLSSYQFCAVTIGASGIALATAGKNCDGVLQDTPTAGTAGTVAMFGVSKVVSGGTGFSAGDLLEVTTNGNFQTKNAGTVVGKAVTTAAAGTMGAAILIKSNALFA